jgi:hypothetical protein
MSRDVRSKAITEAIDNDDSDILSACFVGPVFLTGLGNAERAAMKDRWRRKKFPAEVDRQQRLKAALTDLDRMQAGLLTFVDKMTDAVEIKRAEDAERAALTAKVA